MYANIVFNLKKLYHDTEDTFTRNRLEGFFEIRRNKKVLLWKTCKKCIKQTVDSSDLNDCAVYVCQPYACFKLAEVVADMLRKSISRVNHVLTHIAPAPPLVVT